MLQTSVGCQPGGKNEEMPAAGSPRSPFAREGHPRQALLGAEAVPGHAVGTDLLWAPGAAACPCHYTVLCLHPSPNPWVGVYQISC